MKRKKEEYRKNKIDKFCDILVFVALPLILVLICLFFKITSHASSNNPLPYIVANENVDGFENFIYSLPSSSVSFLSSYFVDAYESGEYFGYDFYEGGRHKFAFYVPQEEFVYSFVLSNDYNDFDITNDYADFTFSNYIFIKGYIDYPYFYGSYQTNTITTPTTVRFFKGSNKGDGNELVPNISSQNYVYNNDEYQVVFGFGNPERPIVPTGHATPPDELQEPVYTQGHSKPQNVPPTYTVNNYIWSTYTPPVVDNSTLEKLVESLTDIVKYNASYLKDNLHNEFTNLIDNIKGLIDYIGQTIQYYGNLIVETLNNLITTFYNNMVSLVESIAESISYIIQPLDTSYLLNQLQSTGIYNDYDAIFSMIHDAFGFYNDIQEPNSFVIPIDLRNVTILHQTQIIYIDLGWLNSCKTIIRGIMWCLLTFSLLYTIIDSIPDYLQGNDE